MFKPARPALMNLSRHRLRPADAGPPLTHGRRVREQRRSSSSSGTSPG